jgi:beta-lactamase regulating signal transducer with metallopeptidase domain
MWPALVNGAVVSVLPATAVWLALRVIPRSMVNAAARHLIWWITAAVVLAFPLLYVPVPATPLAPPAGVTPASLAAVEAGDGGGTVGDDTSPKRPMEISTAELPRWLPMAWMLASGLLLVRLILSYCSLQRKSSRSTTVPPAWRGRAQEWLARIGGHRIGVRLAASAEISVPVAAGPRQPSILVPERLFEELAGAEMDQIGLHEAAHLARRDDWTLPVQRAVEAVFALHPVVRFCGRQIDLEREIACDDRVVEATGRPVAYAACLARLVELCGGVRMPDAAANVMGRRSHLTHRVELLVDRARDTATEAGAPLVLTFAAALFVLTCLLARTPLPVTLAAAPLNPVPAAASTASTMQAGHASDQLSQPPQAGRAKMTVIYFDLTGMEKDAQVQALDGAKKYLRNNVFPEKMAAILTYDGKSVVVRQDFTADSDQLGRSLDQVSASATGLLPVSQNARIAALQTALEKLKPLSGQKDLVFFVCLPLVMDQRQLDKTMELARKASTDFHAIDFRGQVQ